MAAKVQQEKRREAAKRGSAKAVRAKQTKAAQQAPRQAELGLSAAGRAATAKKFEPVFYKVELFIHRPEGDRAGMLKHYERNRDPITLYKSEKEMREAQDAAMVKAFGHK